jgi:predicted dehydrogenase
VHVLCEVPAVNTLEECEQVVRTVEKTGLKYMLAENSCYSDMNLAWKGTISAGALGKVLYAEAEYVHDCRSIMRNADGSLTWRASMPPIHYCTHSLGPLLFLMDDRCVAATGLNTGCNIAPDLGAIDLEVGLFQTESGAIVKILCGFSIERHPAFHWYIVYGTKGALESHRRYKGSPGGYLQEIIPEREMKPIEGDSNAHGTAESRIADGFIQSILNDTKPPIDVYEAMDYTAPGICAHLSSQRKGEVVPVPNYRKRE